MELPDLSNLLHNLALDAAPTEMPAGDKRKAHELDDTIKRLEDDENVQMKNIRPAGPPDLTYPLPSTIYFSNFRSMMAYSYSSPAAAAASAPPAAAAAAPTSEERDAASQKFRLWVETARSKLERDAPRLAQLKAEKNAAQDRWIAREEQRSGSDEDSAEIGRLFTVFNSIRTAWEQAAAEESELKRDIEARIQENLEAWKSQLPDFTDPHDSEGSSSADPAVAVGVPSGGVPDNAPDFMFLAPLFGGVQWFYEAQKFTYGNRYYKWFWRMGEWYRTRSFFVPRDVEQFRADFEHFKHQLEEYAEVFDREFRPWLGHYGGDNPAWDEADTYIFKDHEGHIQIATGILAIIVSLILIGVGGAHLKYRTVFWMFSKDVAYINVLNLTNVEEFINWNTRTPPLQKNKKMYEALQAEYILRGEFRYNLLLGTGQAELRLVDSYAFDEDIFVGDDNLFGTLLQSRRRKLQKTERDVRVEREGLEDA